MFFFVVLLKFDICIMFNVYYLLKMQLQDINYIYVFKLYFVKLKFIVYKDVLRVIFLDFKV